MEKSCKKKWDNYVISALSERILAALTEEWRLNKAIVMMIHLMVVTAMVGIAALIVLACCCPSRIAAMAGAILVVVLGSLGVAVYLVNRRRKKCQRIHNNQFTIKSRLEN